jgi:hypothetical protein
LEAIGAPDFVHKLRFLDLVADPVVLGINAIEARIPLQIVDGRLDVIFRFISLTGCPIPWPRSFSILLNGEWIGKTPNDSNLFHYLPDEVKVNGELEIQCRPENTKSLLVIQHARVEQNLAFSIPCEYDVPKRCAVSFSRATLFPARSSMCHTCGFMELEELVSFIERKGVCPFCLRPVTLKSLVINLNIQQQRVIDEIVSSGVIG